MRTWMSRLRGPQLLSLSVGLGLLLLAGIWFGARPDPTVTLAIVLPANAGPQSSETYAFDIPLPSYTRLERRGNSEAQVQFYTGLSPDEVANFYAQELVARGWRPLSSAEVETIAAATDGSGLVKWGEWYTLREPVDPLTLVVLHITSLRGPSWRSAHVSISLRSLASTR